MKLKTEAISLALLAAALLTVPSTGLARDISENEAKKAIDCYWAGGTYGEDGVCSGSDGEIIVIGSRSSSDHDGTSDEKAASGYEPHEHRGGGTTDDEEEEECPDTATTPATTDRGEASDSSEAGIVVFLQFLKEGKTSSVAQQVSGTAADIVEELPHPSLASQAEKQALKDVIAQAESRAGSLIDDAVRAGGKYLGVAIESGGGTLIRIGGKALGVAGGVMTVAEAAWPKGAEAAVITEEQKAEMRAEREAVEGYRTEVSSDDQNSECVENDEGESPVSSESTSSTSGSHSSSSSEGGSSHSGHREDDYGRTDSERRER